MFPCPRTAIAAVAAVLVTCFAPTAASAHPLGNFTVNHYARIEPAGDRVRVAYVLDMAEIPTFQEQPRWEADPEQFADQRANEIGRNLTLVVNGTRRQLRLDQRALSTPAGAGGLPTLRLEAGYSVELSAADLAGSGVEVTLRDDNDSDRIGWREIVARPGSPETEIRRSSVPANDVTDELRKYPDDLLSTPLDVRQAALTFTPGGIGGSPTLAPATSVVDRTRSAFATLASGGELTPTFVLFALAVAVVLGAAHALQPGHGKTIVAAYLVGARGTAKHALVLGGTVTATHTAGVYALGLVTLFLSQFILPERLYPILEVVSGLLVVGVGVWLFGWRLLSAIGLRAGDHGHSHDDTHHHDGHAHFHADHHADGHTHDAHSHDHLHVARPRQPASERVSWRSLIALGVSGGLLPCPEALMVLLITIAAHRVLFGLMLIVAFSAGLAAVLVGFGILLVYARGLFGRINLGSGLVPRLLPVASALVVMAAGGVITAQALPRVL